MGHDHDHHHDHSSDNIKLAFFLNVSFTIIEILGGIMTNSVAILSDAIHDLGDSLSLGLAWYLQKLSTKGRTQRFTYGYKRFSLLGAIITSIVLIIGSVIILYEAIPRLSQPEATNTAGMIGLSILGVIINGIAVLRTRHGTSINEQVVSWHLLEDVLGWIVVLIGAIVMHFFDIPIIDPVLSIAITLFVVYNVIKRLIKAGKIILQAVPEQIDTQEVETQLESLTAVKDIHHTNLWSLDGSYHVITVHAKIDGNTKVNALKGIKEDIRHRLHHMGIEHVTVEFESIEEECLENETLRR